MSILTRWGDLLALINPEIAEAYLFKKGWRRQDCREWWWTQPSPQHDPPEVIREEVSLNYRDAMLWALSRVERRPVFLILVDLIGVESVYAAIRADLGTEPAGGSEPVAAHTPADLADLAAIRRLRQLKAAGTISDWGIENDGDDGIACVFAAPRKDAEHNLCAGVGPTIAAAVADALSTNRKEKVSR